ncbi:hypothetical protein BU17DRAFT_80298 [Hysterangium stoloniferum]|nr:hypothetical protein BU17DRAFT_80298 [Hysterangium stoloniferum]
MRIPLGLVISQGTVLSSHEYSINRRAPRPQFDSSTTDPSISTSTTLTGSESTSETTTTSLPSTSTPTSTILTSSTPDSIPTSISTTDPISPAQSTSLSTPISEITTSSFIPASSVSTSISSSTSSATFPVASSGSNDPSFTVTQMVANPTGVTGPPPISNPKQGFFSNVGAVAAAFVVIGLFATMFFFCLFLWVARKYRRRQRKQDYFNDQYREFNHSMERRPTPDVTQALVHAVSSPAPDTTEGQMPANISPQYRAEPGEFDPYQPQSIAYAYSDDYADYSEYEQYLGSSQREVVPFIENTRSRD